MVKTLLKAQLIIAGLFTVIALAIKTEMSLTVVLGLVSAGGVVTISALLVQSSYIAQASSPHTAMLLLEGGKLLVVLGIVWMGFSVFSLERAVWFAASFGMMYVLSYLCMLYGSRAKSRG